MLHFLTPLIRSALENEPSHTFTKYRDFEYLTRSTLEQIVDELDAYDANNQWTVLAYCSLEAERIVNVSYFTAGRTHFDAWNAFVEFHVANQLLDANTHERLLKQKSRIEADRLCQLPDIPYRVH